MATVSRSFGDTYAYRSFRGDSWFGGRRWRGGDAASTVGGWWAGLEWQSTEGQGGADSRRKKMREGAT
jgi:hypothetical protein